MIFRSARRCWKPCASTGAGGSPISICSPCAAGAGTTTADGTVPKVGRGFDQTRDFFLAENHGKFLGLSGHVRVVELRIVPLESLLEAESQNGRAIGHASRGVESNRAPFRDPDAIAVQPSTHPRDCVRRVSGLVLTAHPDRTLRIWGLGIPAERSRWNAAMFSTSNPSHIALLLSRGKGVREMSDTTTQRSLLCRRVRPESILRKRPSRLVR